MLCICIQISKSDDIVRTIESTSLVEILADNSKVLYMRVFQGTKRKLIYALHDLGLELG